MSHAPAVEAVIAGQAVALAAYTPGNQQSMNHRGHGAELADDVAAGCKKDCACRADRISVWITSFAVSAPGILSTPVSLSGRTAPTACNQRRRIGIERRGCRKPIGSRSLLFPPRQMPSQSLNTILKARKGGNRAAGYPKPYLSKMGKGRDRRLDTEPCFSDLNRNPLPPDQKTARAGRGHYRARERRRRVCYHCLIKPWG